MTIARQLAVGFASSGWVLVLVCAADFWVAGVRSRASHVPDTLDHVGVALTFFQVAAAWLFIAIFSWAVVGARLLGRCRAARLHAGGGGPSGRSSA